MKTQIMCIVLLSIYCGSVYAQTNSEPHSVKAETWVAIKQSAIDTVELQYFENKGWVSTIEPKNENTNVFLNVSRLVAGLLDQSVNSITEKTNQFYQTGAVGFFATWGVFYAYVGEEILSYIWMMFFIVVCMVLFFVFWKYHCVHRRVKIDTSVKSFQDALQEEEDKISAKLKNAKESVVSSSGTIDNLTLTIEQLKSENTEKEDEDKQKKLTQNELALKSAQTNHARLEDKVLEIQQNLDDLLQKQQAESELDMYEIRPANVTLQLIYGVVFLFMLFIGACNIG